MHIRYQVRDTLLFLFCYRVGFAPIPLSLLFVAESYQIFTATTVLPMGGFRVETHL